MKYRRSIDLHKIGIYRITNNINNKIYVGKSKNIYGRIVEHASRLNNNSKDENIHLLRAWLKYGSNNFEYDVLEYLETFDEEVLRERELYWIETLQSNDRRFGYNLRLDTSTKCLVSAETSMRLSNYMHNRNMLNPELAKNIGKKISEYWKNNESRKKEFGENVSKANIEYHILQYTKSGDFIKEWPSVRELIKSNPEYKWHNIYSVCGGYKPSIYGYIWKKIKITSEDIVRSLEKSEIEESENN